MFSKLRKRFTYANVLMTIALIFAMAGGAYAAKKVIITSTSQISPSVLKKLQGKSGKNGATGAPGATGPAGAKGDPGPQGSKGDIGTSGEKGQAGQAGVQGQPGALGQLGPRGSEGEEGVSGAAGESVAVKTVAKGEPECGGEGGSEFSNKTGKSTACNGSPWVAGGTLPSGKTETGVWNATGTPVLIFGGFLEAVAGSISFNVPLASAPSVIVVESGTGANNGCPESGSLAKPEAEPGNLCIYVGPRENTETEGFLAFDPTTESIGAASNTGAVLFVRPKTAGKTVNATGTWAVTAK